MNKTIALGISALTLVLVACGGEEENTQSSSDSLNAGCITQIKAPPGSAAWKAELDKCLNEGGGPGDVPGGGAQDDDDDILGGGGKSCQTGISCVNGSCTCTAGPSKGKACDGTKSKGATSCSVLCSSC